MAFFRGKKNKKSIAAVLLLIVAIAVSGFFFFHNIKKAAAEWFDQNWLYRQAATVTVTSSSSDVSNLDTWFTMNTSALISANKLQPGCQDLRFTNANGKLLPYFINSGCNTTTTKIWVRIDLVPKNSTIYTLYVYYGNPSAGPGSDPNKFNLYNGLVAYWNMNEPSWTNNCSATSVKDFSVNGNNGMSCPNGTGPVGGASGKYGNAGSFDGTGQYVSASSIPTLYSFTVLAWFKRSGANGGPGDGAWHGIVNGLEGNMYDGIFAWTDGTFIRGYLSLGGSGITADSPTISDPSIWHQVGMRWDGSDLSAILDGVPGTSTSATGTIDISGAAISIGRVSATENWTNGSIDEVRIYNRALSASEIKQLYSDGTSSILTAVQGQSVPSVSFASEENGPGPVAYWKFDEGQGTYVYNAAGKPHATTNLITNPSFEYDSVGVGNPTGWYGLSWGTNTGTVATANDNVYLGAKSGKINVTSWTSGVYGLNVDYYGLPNTTYTMTAWMKADSSRVVEFAAIDSQSNWLDYQSVTVTTSWQKFTHTFTTNSYGMFTYVFRLESLGTLWVDEVQLETQYPTSYCDGSLTSIDGTYVWNGTANNSTSTCTYYPNRGQITGGATWQTENMCVTGKCLKFDGSTGYVDAGSGSSLNLGTGDFTVEYWMKYTGTTAINNEAMPIAKVTAEQNTPGFISGITTYGGDGTNYRTLSAITNGSWGTGNLEAGTYMKPNQWHHIVFIRQGTTLMHYLDGNPDGTRTGVTVVNINNSTSFTVGEESGGFHPFTGSIDDVKIYPYARTADQIKADYNARGSSSGTSVQVGNQSSWMTNGLIGYWKMDEASWNGTAGEVVDSSGAGNNGTAACIGTCSKPTTGAGKFGNGGSFDGVDDYAIKSSFPNIPTGAYTVSAWIKLNQINKEQHIGEFSSTQFYVDENNHLTIGTNTPQYPIGTASLQTNNWYFVTAVYGINGNVGFKIYLNGNLEASSDTSDPFSPSSNFYIASCYSLNSAWVFNGSIDEVRLYNRALSPKEVSDLYNFAPGPVGWWKMDDNVSGDSKTLVDSSTNGNNLTTSSVNGTGMNCKVIGRYGGGCLFDGIDDYASIADNAGLRVGETSGSGATYEAWFMLSTTPTASGTIMKKNGFTPYLATNREIRTDVYYHSASPWYASTGIYATVGTWYFVSVTHDGQTTRLYVNGVLITSNTANDYLSSSVTNALYIGKQFSGLYFPGTIDDVRVYNYARNSKQIAEDMNAGHPSVGSPVGSYLDYWKFDEGYGNTIHDMNTVNGYAGTNHGAAWTNNGKFGKALSFNGTSNYVDFGNILIPDYINSRTYSVWVKPTVQSDNTIFSTGNLYNTKAGYSIFTISSPTQLLVSYSFNNDPYVAYLNCSTDLNQWNYLDFVVDVSDPANTNIKAYKNGVYCDQTTQPPSIGDYDTTFVIGAETNWSDNHKRNFFQGLIDEVKIYPFALTTDDIKTEYNRGALKMGSISDTSGLSGGSVASNSASAAYCIPGDTASCASPVGEWKFDENVSGNNQTLYDTSGNGNWAATNWGGNGFGMNCKVLGKYATGCQFDGVDDYISMGAGNTAPLKVSSVTIEAWVKVNNMSGRPSIVGTNDVGYWMFLDPSGFIYMYLNTAGQGWHDAGNSPTYTWTDGWHHIVTSYDSATHTANYYRDGINVYTNNSSTTGVITYGGGMAGLIAGAENNIYFNGTMDEIRIYNYARTPAQITWDYNRGKPVGWWKFDECQGVTANDSSGNGNVGAITIGGSGSQTTAGTCTTPIDGTGAWYNGKVGKYNSAMSFDGNDDYVNAGTGSSLNYLTAATWEAWVKLNNQNQGFFMYKSDNGAAQGWYMGVRTGYGIGINIVWSGSTDLTKYTSSIPAAGSWFHFAATWAGGSANTSAHVYINGKEVNYAINWSGNGSHDDDSSQPFYIGYGGSVPGGNLNGLIDDVKVYNYPLTPQQILMDYNQGSAVRFGPSQGRP
jgi:hypothetical protein